MAARTRTKSRGKPHYVKNRKRKGAESAVFVQRSVVVLVSLFIISVTAIGIGFGCKWIWSRFFSSNPRFEIQHLVISCDGTLGEEQIREYTGLREGMNLYEFSFEHIQEELSKVPVVESVVLERKLPGTLYITVKERVPVARILINNFKTPRLLDRYGVILPPRVSPSLASLPLIKGLEGDIRMGERSENRDIDCALEIIALCQSKKYLHTYIPIESLDIKYADFIDMRLTGETRVRMPRFQLEAKLFYLASVIDFATSQGRRVQEIDLTLDSEKAPVRYY